MRNTPVVFSDGIVWSYSRSARPNGVLVVVALGAPGLEDIDALRNADAFLDAGYDIIVPEYYGFCRSSGVFTPQNSIRTLLETKRNFSRWTVEDIYTGMIMPVSYDRFVFMGISYGGGVVPILPRYDEAIDTIACFYPVLEYASLGLRGVQEETVDDFLGAIRRWFALQYRGIEDSEWSAHFSDTSWLTAMKSLDDLAKTRVFLAHGTTDESVWCERTREYAQMLRTKYPNNNIVYREYPWCGHGSDTLLPATRDLIAWLSR